MKLTSKIITKIIDSLLRENTFGKSILRDPNLQVVESIWNGAEFKIFCHKMVLIFWKKIDFQSENTEVIIQAITLLPNVEFIRLYSIFTTFLYHFNTSLSGKCDGSALLPALSSFCTAQEGPQFQPTLKVSVEHPYPLFTDVSSCKVQPLWVHAFL